MTFFAAARRPQAGTMVRALASNPDCDGTVKTLTAWRDANALTGITVTVRARTTTRARRGLRRAHAPRTATTARLCCCPCVPLQMLNGQSFSLGKCSGSSDVLALQPGALITALSFHTRVLNNGSAASATTTDAANPIFPLQNRRLYGLTVATNQGTTWSTENKISFDRDANDAFEVRTMGGRLGEVGWWRRAECAGRAGASLAAAARDSLAQVAAWVGTSGSFLMGLEGLLNKSGELLHARAITTEPLVSRFCPKYSTGAMDDYVQDKPGSKTFVATKVRERAASEGHRPVHAAVRL